MRIDKSQLTGGASVLLSLVLAAFLLNQLNDAPEKKQQPLKPVPQQVDKPPKPANPKPTQRSMQASEATFQAIALPPPPAPKPVKTAAKAVEKPAPKKAPQKAEQPKPVPKPVEKKLPKQAPVKKAEAKQPPKTIKVLKPTVKKAPLQVAKVEAVKHSPERVTQPKKTVQPLKAMKPTPEPIPQSTTKIKRQTAPSPKKEVRLSQRTIRTSEVQGRVLLRQLEKGAGPIIAIEWPSHSGRADALYRTLRSCYGMRTALLAEGEGALYVADGVSGRPWRPRPGAVSGFVRQPAGQIPSPEQRTIQTIESLHGLHGATPVRIFPRREDSVLLGGLLQLVGPGYKQAKEIHARYQLQGRAVLVTNVTVDGRALNGRVVMDWGCAS